MTALLDTLTLLLAFGWVIPLMIWGVKCLAQDLDEWEKKK
jgi:hypothetical protein